MLPQGRRRGAVCLLLLLILAGLLLYRSQQARLTAGEARAIEALAWAALGQTIAVDPGHGGIDAGAVGPGGTLEKDLVLELSYELVRLLRFAGAQVFLTRGPDTSPDTTVELDERVKLAADRRATLFVSVHANSFDRHEYGAQTFFDPGAPEGKRLAESIQAAIRSRLKNTERAAAALDAYVLRNQPAIPAAIVEVGFLSNPREEGLLKTKAYQRQMAAAICLGILDFLGSEPKPAKGQQVKPSP